MLWLRQLWLYTLASAARQRLVLFLKEHPRDPEEYKSQEDTNIYPSFYAWPEWQVFRDQYNLKEVRLDLGALGHERRKPTTLRTNISWLSTLDGLTARQVRDQVLSAEAPLQDRTSQSRGRAAWPLRFKEEIVKGIVLDLDGKLMDSPEEDQGRLGQDVVSAMETARALRPCSVLKEVHYLSEGRWKTQASSQSSSSGRNDFELGRMWPI